MAFQIKNNADYLTPETARAEMDPINAQREAKEKKEDKKAAGSGPAVVNHIEKAQQQQQAKKVQEAAQDMDPNERLMRQIMDTQMDMGMRSMRVSIMA